MTGLADQLGVNRVTLYRWVGTREALLVEIIWSLAERTLDDLRDEVDATGGERVVQVVSRFVVRPSSSVTYRPAIPPSYW